MGMYCRARYSHLLKHFVFVLHRKIAGRSDVLLFADASACLAGRCRQLDRRTGRRLRRRHVDSVTVLLRPLLHRGRIVVLVRCAVVRHGTRPLGLLLIRLFLCLDWRLICLYDSLSRHPAAHKISTLI